MKFDRQKTFPYPVLRPYSDDYVGVEFQAAVEFSIEKNDISVKCDYLTSSEELAREIENGRAKYVSIISCRNTYFRKVIATEKREISEKVDANLLKGEVDVDSYIVAVKRITNFTSGDINKEFGKTEFEFEPGQVLAQEEPLAVYIDRDLFKPLTSVFELVRNEALQGAEWRVGLDQDHVQIEVSGSMKESIDNARNSTANKCVLLNSLYFSSVVHAIQALKDGGEYGQFQWGKVVMRQAHNNGIDFDGTDAYVIAQKLMKHPLGVLNTYVLKGGE